MVLNLAGKTHWKMGAMWFKSIETVSYNSRVWIGNIFINIDNIVDTAFHSSSLISS